MLRHLIPAVVASAAIAAPAQAATLAYSGDTLVLKASGGEENFVTFGSTEAGKVSISDSGATYTLPAGCSQEDPQYAIHCTTPERLVADFGDRNDTVVVDHMTPQGMVLEVAAGDGDDSIKAIAGNTRLTADGGAGNDKLRSEEGGDTLRGGAGADELLGNRGADVLEGGDGDDTLTGDACGTPAADVLDGGAGLDKLTDWGQCGPTPDPRPITVTVNGQADDGRPGEGDDVRDLDVLELFVPATVIGTDEADSVGIYAPGDGAPSTIDGRGGDDDLRAGSARETIDGGAGNDTIEGGFGHDTLTAGPGRDVVHGDSTAGNCGGYGQSCTVPFGNDTIDVRDGEADQVACGPGEDTVRADARDVIADDCETVEGGKATAAAAVTVKRQRAGLKVRLSGFAPGAVKVVVKAGRRKVASARAAVKADGTATVRLRLDREDRGRALTVSAGAVRTAVA